jgi:hypothetical protein
MPVKVSKQKAVGKRIQYVIQLIQNAESRGVLISRKKWKLVKNDFKLYHLKICCNLRIIYISRKGRKVSSRKERKED